MLLINGTQIQNALFCYFLSSEGSEKSGHAELNFRLRNGNGCDPSGNTTGNLSGLEL